MTPELVEISLHILKVLALLMSAPLVFSVFYKVFRLILNAIDPVKIIEIESTDIDGNKSIQVIKLDNTDELVQALLKARAKNV